MTDTDFSTLRILLVEDNDFQRKIMVKILETLGAREVVQASNGADALTVLASFTPDIVLTDSRMEPMDGLEMARQIRSSEGDAFQTVPMIMISVEGHPDEVRAARDAGIEDFLVKPVRPEILRDRIRHLLRNPRPFIRCEAYIGPDRRVRQHPPPPMERRQMKG